jgi:hypothetical protein
LARFAAPAIAKLPTIGRGIEQKIDIPTDFVEFAAQCQIKSGSEFVPFKLYDYQILLGELLGKYPKHCWFKTRQLGASETAVCYAMQEALLNPAYTGVVFSIGQKESSKLADRARNMPQFRGFEWEYQSGQRLKAVNGGDQYFYPPTENAARGVPSVDRLIFDEAGFIHNLESLYASSTPSQSMLGDRAKRVLISTMPKGGTLTLWWQIFVGDCPPNIDIEEKIARVREGRGEYGAGVDYWIDNSGWCKVLLHWKSHPMYCLIPDYLDVVRNREKLTKEQTGREYDLEIPKESGSLFDMDCVKKQAIAKWDSPQPRHRYLMGIDPSFGGEDYYTALVFDVTQHPYKLVHQYRESRKANAYYESKIIEIIKAYRPQLVAIESNSGGIVLIEHLQTKMPGLRVEKVSHSSVSKRVNTDRIAIAIENADVIYPPDWEFCSEFSDGTTKRASEASQFLASTRQAVQGHDDTVMAFAVAFAWVEDATKVIPSPAIGSYRR